MKCGSMIVALCVFSTAFADTGSSAVHTNTIASAGLRDVRHVNLSFRFSEESFLEDPFDVCGWSAGFGLDLVPGRMKGLQMAGFLGGAESFSGVQLSLLAATAGSGMGLQVGGLCSMTDHDFSGLQIGLLNATASGVGMQVSLGICETDEIFNLADSLRNRGRVSRWSGVQCAGLANRACSLGGIQAAIAFNYAVQCSGVQIGCWNRSDELYGFQLGAINRADELHGFQVGIFNQARKGSGIQVGLINSFGENDDRLVLPLVNAKF